MSAPIISQPATGHDIKLTQANNNFNSIAASGLNVDITDTNAVILAAINATTLDVLAGGDGSDKLRCI